LILKGKKPKAKSCANALIPACHLTSPSKGRQAKTHGQKYLPKFI